MHGHMNVNLSRCTVAWTSIYHDARSPERQFITMYGHMNVHLSRCTVTWTSIYHDARSHERQFITMHGHMNVNLSRCTVNWTSNSIKWNATECLRTGNYSSEQTDIWKTFVCIMIALANAACYVHCLETAVQAHQFWASQHLQSVFSPTLGTCRTNTNAKWSDW